jgi:hypothetical protein
VIDVRSYILVPGAVLVLVPFLARDPYSDTALTTLRTVVDSMRNHVSI